jgi:HlyD family secretion protein
LKSIKLNKKLGIIVIVIVAILTIGVTSYVKAHKVKVKQVTTSKISKKKVTQSTTVTGNIEAKYRNEITLNPAQKVVKVLVTEGQQVKKGDVLVQLDTIDLESQLEKFNLTLEGDESTLKQISGSGSASESSNGEKEITQAQTSLENAQRNYDDTNKKLQQNQNLLNGGYISKTDFDASKKAADDAASTLRGAESTLTNAQTSLGNINASNNDKIISQRNKIAITKSDIESTKKKIEDSKIKANTDGKVIVLDAKEDQLPKADDKIIVDDNSQYKVSIDVSQYDATKVVKGQKANVKVKGSTKKYTGSVTEIGQLARTKATDTDKEFKVNVKLLLDNPDENIKTGYEADAEIILNEKANTVSISLDSIKSDKSSKKKYVYVLDNKNKVSKRFINTGIETDYDAEVLSGLKDGEKYILNPAQDLKEGDTVVEASNAEAGGTKK